MIIDYTPQEQALRDEAFTKLLDAEKDDTETKADACRQMDDIQKQAEQRILDSMKGNVTAILEEAKRQVDLVMKRLSWSGNLRENFANAAAKDHPDGRAAAELNKGIDSLTFDTMFVDGRYAVEYKKARQIIGKEIKILTDYLKSKKTKAATAASKEITAYIRQSLEADPHFYDSREKPKKPLPEIPTFAIQNDKVNHRIQTFDDFECIDQDGQTAYTAGIVQNKINKSKQIVDTLTLTFADLPQNQSRPVGLLDAPIYNAVSTAFFYHQLYGGTGSLIITPQEIWRLICGTQDPNRNPSPNQLKQITDAMDRMRFTRIKLDISDSLRYYHLQVDDERIVNGEIDTYYLEASKGKFVTEKGRIVSGYEIPRAPVLYVYAAAKKHIVAVPLSLLDTGETTGNEGITPAVRQYLLNRILLMYHDKHYKPTILYESLYTATGIQPPELRLNRENFSTDTSFDTATRREAARDREKVKEILDAWKAKRLILDYEPLKEGRKNVGVNIVLYKGTPPALTRKNQ